MVKPPLQGGVCPVVAVGGEGAEVMEFPPHLLSPPWGGVGEEGEVLAGFGWFAGVGFSGRLARHGIVPQLNGYRIGARPLSTAGCRFQAIALAGVRTGVNGPETGWMDSCRSLDYKYLRL